MKKSRHNPSLIAGAAIVAVIAAAAILGPWIVAQDPLAIDLGRVLAGPSLNHPLGCDALGRDVLARVLWGARLSLGVSTIVVAVSRVIGSAVGGAAALAGGRADELLMRGVDILLAFPGILLAIALAAILGPGLADLVIALGAIGWTGYARLVRGEVLSLREREYVQAARALGARPSRIMIRHLIPALAAPVAVQATFGVGGIIVAEAALSFLGLGQQPPAPSWGSMLNSAQRFLTQAPWLAIFPGIAIFLVVLSFNLVGDGLRDALAPRSK